MGKPITDTWYVRFHVGRSWSGHRLEDECICIKASCGLIENEDPDCDQHGVMANKTMRQSHRADQCPGPDVPPTRSATDQSGDWRTRTLPYVTLVEAAGAMGITTGRLRHSMVDGPDEGGALARRLGMFKLPGGRDWLIPRDRLLAELDRRKAANR